LARQKQRVKFKKGGASHGTGSDQSKTAADRFLACPGDRLIDEMLHTPPTFMLGLFFLGLLLCIGRLYKDAWDRVGTRRKARS